MSSLPTNTRVSASVYRMAFSLTAGFILLAVVLLWSVYLTGLALEHQTIKSQLHNQSKELMALYNTEGVDGVIEAISIDERHEWEQEDIHHIYDDEEYVFSVYQNQSFIAGYPALNSQGFQEPNTVIVTFLDDEDFDVQPLLKLNLVLTEDIEITLAKFEPEIWSWRKEYLNVISLTLVIIMLPLSLLIASVLSNRVNQRIDAMSAVLAKVGETSMQDRLPVANKPNEFDSLSANINQMLDRVGTLTKNIEYTSAGIAHDLKTPISNVAGRLQLMERDIANPELIKNHIEKVQENISSLLRTLDALLRLGEVEAGKRRQAFKPTNLSNVALDIADSFQPVLEEADKQFQYSIEPELSLLGDTDLLVQLLSNLLENAVEHTRDGAAIEFVVKASNNTVQVKVTDDGPGITQHDAARIFDRFHRADTSRGSPGNGLGLSLVRAIAELHGGSAKLLAKQDGSTFVVTLPLLKG